MQCVIFLIIDQIMAPYKKISMEKNCCLMENAFGWKKNPITILHRNIARLSLTCGFS